MILFLQELNQSPVGVTFCGLFMITREAAVTVSIHVNGPALENYKINIRIETEAPSM